MQSYSPHFILLFGLHFHLSHYTFTGSLYCEPFLFLVTSISFLWRILPTPGSSYRAANHSAQPHLLPSSPGGHLTWLAKVLHPHGHKDGHVTQGGLIWELLEIDIGKEMFLCLKRYESKFPRSFLFHHMDTASFSMRPSRGKQSWEREETEPWQCHLSHRI